MIPGPPKLVICPFCGAMKELMTLASGNTIDTIYWSDLKVFAPMLPQVSPVQKCPHCGMYYLEHKQTSLMGCGRGSLECGKLNYPEWKEAYHQFCNQADIVKSTKWWKRLLKSNKCRIANEKEMMNIKFGLYKLITTIIDTAIIENGIVKMRQMLVCPLVKKKSLLLH